MPKKSTKTFIITCAIVIFCIYFIVMAAAGLSYKNLMALAVYSFVAIAVLHFMLKINKL